MDYIVSCKWIAESLDVSDLTVTFYLLKLQLERTTKDDGFYVSLDVAEELIKAICLDFAFNTDKHIDQLKTQYQD